MRRQEKSIFCKLLANIAEFYSKTLSANVLEIYWNVLEKYELVQVKQALNLHLVNPANGQFMPKPADIIRYIEKDNSLKALHAWDKAISGVRAMGSYHSITFDDPVINIVINEMGGWVNLCCTSNDKLPFIANEFQRRYAAYLIYTPPPAPNYLPGIFEYQNRLAGFHKHIPKPIFFSDKDVQLLISDFKIDEENKDE
jgi:hypothetical protein